uniref:Uncharacterized protein n=1 Tax=uncultured marine virus TaxID=186617 RepID=A0A0F7L733_9VIRU|nr:hypothetical protein [uncultured marine virus]
MDDTKERRHEPPRRHTRRVPPLRRPTDPGVRQVRRALRTLRHHRGGGAVRAPSGYAGVGRARPLLPHPRRLAPVHPRRCLDGRHRCLGPAPRLGRRARHPQR